MAQISTQPDTLACRGVLAGHRDWVTSISTTLEAHNMVVSASRDKKVFVWQLTPNEEQPGYARKCLGGHSGPVVDVVISSDGAFALSGSWDSTLRLWDLNSGKTVRVFNGHKQDVNSVAFSQDNRQIVSAGRDKTIIVWNTLAQCKYVIEEDQHTDWISCVRFSPSQKSPMLVTGGWDNLVKVWELLTLKLRFNLSGHTGPVYSVTISPDGSLCASGGKCGTVMLWDVNEGKKLYSLDAQSSINSMAFSPKSYWLCAATDAGVKVWDLETKNLLQFVPNPVRDDARMLKEGKKSRKDPLAWSVSIQWSADGNMLFVGGTDGNIHVYEVLA